MARFATVIDPRLRDRGEDVLITIDSDCKQAGYPNTVRADQGREFAARDLDLGVSAQSHA